jgi:hypothetical protein
MARELPTTQHARPLTCRGVGSPLRDLGGVVDRREAGRCSAHADNKLSRGRHDGCLRSEGVPGYEFPRVGHGTRGLPFPALAPGRLLATTKAAVNCATR